MPYGNLKPEGYISRIVDSKLERLLGLFGAVEVAGTMWCGKTWTSLARAESVTRIGLSGPRSAAEADPSTALIGARPHLVDEWQDVPAIWDEVRAAVDADAASQGSFILTGSAEPNKDKVHHSGAGRIAKLRMSTMTLQETGVSSGAVSLAGLFEGRFEPQLVQQKLEPLATAVCKGGWPALAASEGAQPEYLDYQKQVIANAQAMCKAFLDRGYHVVSGGTDNHLMLIDLRNKFPEVSGRVAEKELEKADITLNKNMVPYDSRSPFQTSGFRIGTPAVTSRGFVEKDMEDIVELIDTVLASCASHIAALTLKKGEEPTPEQEASLYEHRAVIEKVAAKVHQMTAGYPLNKY